MDDYHLNECIKELKKKTKERNITLISNYLKTLESFMSLLQEQNERYEEILSKASGIMTYQQNKKNDLVNQYGEKGSDFFVILKGKVEVLVPKMKEYYMSAEEYISFLLKLKLNNQNQLINECLKQNEFTFSIPYENFEEFIYDLSKQKTKCGIFLDKKTLIEEAKIVQKFIKNKNKNNELNNPINIDPKKYISRIEINNEIKEINNKINQSQKKGIDENLIENRKKVKIGNYEVLYTLETGETFGEINNGNSRRISTIIALEDCDFGIIDRKEYNDLIKDSITKSKNKFYNLIYSYKIFNCIKQGIFDQKYYSYFKYCRLNKNSLLLKDGNKCNEVYFISSGEYKIFIEANLYEIDGKISILRDSLFKIKNDSFNPNKHCFRRNSHNWNDDKYREIDSNISEIDKENEINYYKRFQNKYFNKMMTIKNKIPLGIYKSRQIIGLCDLVNRGIKTENNEINCCIINCECISCSSELYCINYDLFLKICEKEENVLNYTNELLIQNIYCMIERLLEHRKYIYENINKKNNEIISNIMNTQKEQEANLQKTKIGRVIEKKIENKDLFLSNISKNSSFHEFSSPVSSKVHTIDSLPFLYKLNKSINKNSTEKEARKVFNNYNNSNNVHRNQKTFRNIKDENIFIAKLQSRNNQFNARLNTNSNLFNKNSYLNTTTNNSFNESNKEDNNKNKIPTFSTNNKRSSIKNNTISLRRNVNLFMRENKNLKEMLFYNENDKKNQVILKDKNSCQIKESPINNVNKVKNLYNKAYSENKNNIYEYNTSKMDENNKSLNVNYKNIFTQCYDNYSTEKNIKHDKKLLYLGFNNKTIDKDEYSYKIKNNIYRNNLHPIYRLNKVKSPKKMLLSMRLSSFLKKANENNNNHSNGRIILTEMDAINKILNK